MGGGAVFGRRAVLGKAVLERGSIGEGGISGFDSTFIWLLASMML